jgi:DNA-binding XRE family transcriptional regulator
VTAPARQLVDCPKCGSRKALSVPSGAWLAQRRRARGRGQRELADEVGIEQATLSRIEHGHQVPKPETLAKLGRVLEFQP